MVSWLSVWQQMWLSVAHLERPHGSQGTGMAERTLKPAVTRFSPGSLPQPSPSSRHTLINPEWPMITDHRKQAPVGGTTFIPFTCGTREKVLRPGAKGWRLNMGPGTCARAASRLHGLRQVTSHSECQLPSNLGASSWPYTGSRQTGASKGVWTMVQTRAHSPEKAQAMLRATVELGGSGPRNLVLFVGWFVCFLR